MKDVRLDPYGALVEIPASELPPPDRFVSNARRMSMDDTDLLPIVEHPDDFRKNGMGSRGEPSPKHFTGERKRFLVLGLCVGAIVFALADMLAHHPANDRIRPTIASVVTHSIPVQARRARHIAITHPAPHRLTHRTLQRLASISVVHHPTAIPTSVPIVAKPLLSQTISHPPAIAHHQAPRPMPPQIAELSIQPSSIESGKMALLYARSIHARKLFITGSGVAQWAYPIVWVPLHPVRTTTYQITAINAQGLKTRRSITVRVMPTPTPSVQTVPATSITSTRHGHHHRRSHDDRTAETNGSPSSARRVSP